MSILRSLDDRISLYGERPRDLTPLSALNEVCKAKDLYTQEPQHMAPYLPDKLKVTKGATTPLPLESVLPAGALRLATDFKKHVLKSESELEADRLRGVSVTPYWCPDLRRSKQRRRELFATLCDRQLLTFRRRIFSRVSIFFVWKKTGMTRLIVDARSTNEKCRMPPHTDLGTIAALADVDLSLAELSDIADAELSTEEEAELLKGQGGLFSLPFSGSSLDVVDGFYQFDNWRMASWFGMDDPDEAGVYGVTEVWDDDLEEMVPLQPTDIVYPCFRALSMGFTWALYFCHSAVEHIVAAGVPGGASRAAREKHRAPQASFASPITSTYVDNAALLSANTSTSDLQTVLHQFSARDMRTHDIVEHTFALEHLGAVFDGHRRLLHHQPRRVWRVYLAGKELLRRRRLRGEVLRVWIGHVVHLFMLNRPALSCLWAVYQFIQHALERRCRVWGSVRQEIKVILGLVFLCQRDLSAPRLRMAYCSDSSDLGYCLAVTSASDAELREAAAYHERWRFIEDRSDPRCELVPYLELCDSAGLSPLGGSPEPWREDHVPPAEFAEHFESESYGRILVRCPHSRWKTLFERKWNDPTEHINTKEGRVMLAGLRRACRNPRCHKKRLLSLSDSLVACCAFDRGRGRGAEKTNWGLRYLGQRAAALQIACDIQWATRHLEGVRNPTDAGSRRFDGGADPTEKARNLGLERGGHDMAIEAPIIEYGAPQDFYGASHGHFKGFSVFFGSRQDLLRDSIKASKPKGYDLNRTLRFRRGAIFLELFAGHEGLTRAVASLGVPSGEGIELSKGPEYDLLDPGIRLGARRQRLARPPAARHGPAPLPRNLVENSVSATTLHTYKAEVGEFEAWAAGRVRSLRTHEAADSAMSDYFEWLYAQREQPQIGRWALYGYALLRLSHLGRGGHVLPRAKAALRGWIRQMPGRIRDPCPIEAAWLIVQWLLLKNQAFYFWCALAVVLQVDTYVRPGALMGIKREDLLPPIRQRGSRYTDWGLVLSPSTRAGKTKSGEQDDTLVIGILDRTFVKDVAAFLHGSAHDGERVFRHLTLPSYEKSIKEASEALELDALRIVPHCFRHTGPSTDAYLNALSIQQIQDRGKWKCPASVRRYEKHAALLRQLHKMTPRQRREAIAAGRQLPDLLKHAFRQYR
ncbi:unnamed protein product [Prorocentrum cordatum]|uniref:Uncharacterized protein n=1 Tax=Prorocentrum cordatum TaxID=2364126 RepID=A0ABN9VCW8_9DINO|nr:unnamed protein product [Polarella glacialis]